MANNNLLTMASLEVTMWRPTPQKPDEVIDEPGKNNDFIAAEKINKMFEIVASTNGAQKAPQFKTTIETEIETKAALSAQILLWRPTPQRPDVAKTSVLLEPFNVYLLIEPEGDWNDVEWTADKESEPKPKYVRSIKITKGERTNGKRTLDLTATFQPEVGNGNTDKDKKNKPVGNVEVD